MKGEEKKTKGYRRTRVEKLSKKKKGENKKKESNITFVTEKSDAFFFHQGQTNPTGIKFRKRIEEEKKEKTKTNKYLQQRWG